MRLITVLITISTFLFLSACGDVERSANELIDFADEQATGQLPPGGRHALILHPGLAAGDLSSDEVHAAVARVADIGGVLQVRVVQNGNAVSSPPLALPNGGDLALESRNPSGRAEEAATTTTEIMALLAPHLVAESDSLDEADLFGALRLAVEWAGQGPADEPASVTIITGGGVHRSETLDLLDVSDAGQSADIDAFVPDGLSHVEVRVTGVGQFPGLEHAPLQSFTETVLGAWTTWCETASVNSCSVNGITVD